MNHNTTSNCGNKQYKRNWISHWITPVDDASYRTSERDALRHDRGAGATQPH